MELETFRNKYRDTEIVIVDEISMVSAYNFRIMNSRLNKLQDTGNLHGFGGLGVILVGDFYQLPPINPPPVYECSLFMHNFKVFELLQNMRQTNQSFSKALDEIRIGAPSPSTWKLLRTRLQQNISSEIQKQRFDDAVHLFPKNEQVNQFNDDAMKRLQDNGAVVYKIFAHDVVEHAPANRGRLLVLDVLPANLRETNAEKAAGLENCVKLTVGAVVRLRYNIDTSRGLVNGARGVVAELIVACKDGEQHLTTHDPVLVKVKFYDYVVGLKAEKRPLKPPKDWPAIEIKPIKVVYNMSRKNYYGYRICRRQLPLKLSFAQTIHSVQGLTFDNVVISLEDSSGRRSPWFDGKPLGS